MKHRVIGAALSLIMTAGMAAPLAARATSVSVDGDYRNYSIEQLESLINKLQKQLEEAKKGSKCFVSDKNLSIGDGEPGDGTDGEVRRLQSFLKEKGHFNRSATGYFGKVTRAALEAFQRANGLPVTGEFDGKTREKAHSYACKTVIKANVKTEKKVEIKEEKRMEMSGVVKGISLMVNDGVARWKVDGYSAQGFKIVWSKNSSPTYPNRDGDTYNYLSEPSASESGLKAFSGSGTYYVRVCEYLGGACGAYSNEAVTQL